MSRKEMLMWGAIIVSLVIGIVGFLAPKEKEESLDSKGKFAYVELQKVFNEFEMKQELETKLKQDISIKQSTLDSLMFRLQTLNNELSSQKTPKPDDIEIFNRMQQYYAQQKQAVENYTNDQTMRFDSQILTQMQQYIKDFGKQNGYNYIFGTKADESTILFAPEENNITQEVILFINNSYQGKN